MPIYPPKKGTEIKYKQNTLLVDGNALYKRGYNGAKTMFNRRGENIGGIYQFLTMLRKLMTEELYHKVYVFWDGDFSGKLRWELYSDYKSARGKDYINGTKPEDEDELLQRRIIFNYLEELYIRQLIDEKVESDDFIAYYCNKNTDENITIVTSDVDLTQLITDNVRMYMLHLKTYVTKENFFENFKYHHENVAIIKILCGDKSDSIKGVKSIGEETLFSIIPELKTRKVELEEIIAKTKALQEQRITEKKKPLTTFTNIINGITDGVQGDNLYEINKQLIDLTTPLLTEEAIINVEKLISSQLSDDRTIKSAYQMLKNDGIDELMSEYRYDDYLLPFKKLMEREKRNNEIIN